MIKRIWDWLFKSKRVDLVVTEEMRQKSLEFRRINAQIASLEKQVLMKERLEALQGMIAGSNASNTEAKIVEFLISKFSNNPQTQPSQQKQTLVQYSDEQIRSFIKSKPDMIQKVAEMKPTDNELAFEITQQFPDLPTETVVRTVAIIKQEAQIQ